MSAIRFLTDEDIHVAVAVSLRAAGIDAVSTPECGRREADDESQLEYAAQLGRATVTFNVADFARLHADWRDQNRSHAGIIVSSQRPIGEVVRRLKRLSQALDADAMQNRIEFLSNW